MLTKRRALLPGIAMIIILFGSCSDPNENITVEPAVAIPEQKVNAPKKEKTSKSHVVKVKERQEQKMGLGNRVEAVMALAAEKGYSTKYCFFIDMSLPGGRKRFYVYDLESGSIAWSGLVAHGSCNEGYMSHPRFSNSNESGCSSLGKYKVGGFYNGKYGPSYKLYGLESCNSNAFTRGVVIHGHECVPDDEVYPMAMCNSFGCPMVSFNFFDRLSGIIDHSDKPILLWIYR